MLICGVICTRCCAAWLLRCQSSMPPIGYAYTPLRNASQQRSLDARPPRHDAPTQRCQPCHDAQVMRCYGYGYGNGNAATLLGSTAATQSPTSPSSATPHRLRIGHGYGYAATMLGNVDATATMPRTAAKSSTLPISSATTPIFAGAVPPPLRPHGPGALPRAHRGLPLARSKLRFGTAMPRSNNLDKTSKDGE